MQIITLTLFGTSGCHLCDAALKEVNLATQLLKTTSTIQLFEVDIIDDDALFDLYQTKIPVLIIEMATKTESLNWPFNQGMIRETIEYLDNKKAS